MEDKSFTLKEKYPTFRTIVEKNRLVTNGDWWRTSLPGQDRWILIKDLPYSVKGIIRSFPMLGKFNKDLYLEENGEFYLYEERNSPLLAIRADTMMGQDVIECIMLDHKEVVFTE